MNGDRHEGPELAPCLRPVYTWAFRQRSGGGGEAIGRRAAGRAGWSSRQRAGSQPQPAEAESPESRGAACARQQV